MIRLTAIQTQISKKDALDIFYEDKFFTGFSKNCNLKETIKC